jgi:hypothetical protein
VENVCPLFEASRNICVRCEGHGVDLKGIKKRHFKLSLKGNTMPVVFKIGVLKGVPDRGVRD